MEFNFDLINILVFISLVLNSSLGFFVLFTNKKNKANRYFFLFSLSATLWGLTMFLFRGFVGTELELWFARTLYVTASFIPFSFIFFIKHFPEAKYNLPKFFESILFLPLIFIVAVSIYPGLLIDHITKPLWGEESIIVFNNIYYIIYGLYILAYFSIGYILILIKYFKFEGLKKTQIKYVFWGTLVGTIIGITTNLIMPLLGYFQLHWVGQIGILAMVGAISYSILQHKLFDTKAIAAQFVVFSLCALLFIRALLSSSYSDFVTNAIFLILAVFMGILLVRSIGKEVAQRKHIEKLAKDLERANEKLKKLDRLKSEFLSLATHQIRAPLTAIRGYSSMLAEGDFGILPSKAKSSVETILKSCQNLINIVEDFLNVSRIEQGGMVYEKGSFDVVELIEEVAEEVRPTVKGAGLYLKLKIPDNLTAEINADKHKIRQVIVNIVDNSIKYTARGGIDISLSSDEKEVRIAIKDSGIGIDSEEMEKIFGKFARAKEAHKTSATGTGLGLYVAKQIMDAHRGSIKAESEGIGKGSTFTIGLPLT